MPANRKSYFHYKAGELFCEEVPLGQVAEKVGTPLYLYSYNSLISGYRQVSHAFSKLSPLICYSLKANANLTLCRILATEGAGADILSGGELYKALEAGFSPQKIVFAGPGKNEEEIEYALRENIFIFNVESPGELRLIGKVSQRLNQTARVSLRINPDVDPKTHHYITTGKRENKFGLDFDEAKKLYPQIKKSSFLEPVGIHFHLGSQITSLHPYLRALEKILEFIKLLKKKGLNLKYLDMGGGFGISYEKGKPPLNIKDLAEKIYSLINSIGAKLILEPGRFLVGPSGVLITQVLYKKNRGKKRFIIVDAGMNDLIRPSLYGAYHQIKKLKEPEKAYSPEVADVVGPVCESADFFAQGRELPPIRQGEYLAIMDTGAYSFSMSFTYNARPRPAEVLVKEDHWWVIRRRETYKDLVKEESIPQGLFFPVQDSYLSSKSCSMSSLEEKKTPLTPIPFTKLQASGNDFIVIDNRGQFIKNRSQFARRSCPRKTGIGADGVLLLEKSRMADFKMRIFNPDGSEPEMCGNGARCIAKFAHLKKIVGEKCSFETLSGKIFSQVKKNQVRIRMKDPSISHLNLEINLGDRSYIGHFLDTGVPHFVLFVPGVEKIDLPSLGPRIRHHRKFQPRGSNVDFAEIEDETVRMRTYERGVEAETLSCGTGAVATAIAANLVYSLSSPVKVKTPGGDLKIYFQKSGAHNFTEVFLEGEAEVVYEGKWEGEVRQCSKDVT
ncbi:MAG: diaminopimelate decarboxylase [bacterium]